MHTRPHHRLFVWQKSVELIELIYRLAAGFPKEERYGLSSQMKRASVSVSSNIAEGAARITNAEKLHFFYVARGSLSELETQIEISARLSFLSSDQAASVRDLINTVAALLQGLVDSRKNRMG